MRITDHDDLHDVRRLLRRIMAELERAINTLLVLSYMQEHQNKKDD
jgi:hypothetical protein